MVPSSAGLTLALRLQRPFRGLIAGRRCRCRHESPKLSVMAGSEPPRRWTTVSAISLVLGISALVLFVFGLATLRVLPLGSGAAGLGASFAGISTGWALDFKLPPNTLANGQRFRIRTMQMFFALVVLILVVFGALHSGA
jgi:hypothetical protein